MEDSAFCVVSTVKDSVFFVVSTVEDLIFCVVSTLVSANIERNMRAMSSIFVLKIHKLFNEISMKS